VGRLLRDVGRIPQGRRQRVHDYVFGKVNYVPYALFFARDSFMIMFSAKTITSFLKCDPSATRVRPECDPSATRRRVHDYVFGKVHYVPSSITCLRPVRVHDYVFGKVHYVPSSITCLRPLRAHDYVFGKVHYVPSSITCPRPVRVHDYVFGKVNYVPSSITCLRPLRVHDNVFGKVHEALSRVRPECDPSATRMRHSTRQNTVIIRVK
jgi:hypothetical protein